MKLRFILLAFTMFLPNIVYADNYKKMDIQFLSALIGPTKVNGKSWDASKSPIGKGAAVFTNMIAPGSGIPISTVISTVNTIAAQGSAAPDVVGYVVQKGPTIKSLVNYAGIPLALATDRNKTKDSYTPRFYAGYSGWPIFDGTKFQIQLLDKDFINDDQIAVVEISKKDLQIANENGKPTWINVSDQSMNQLLFILISVSDSLPSTRPEMVGQRW